MAEPAHSRVTIREVAEEAGVSIATVSRVLNGRDDVAPETRELVSRIAQERGYIANRGARGLSAGRTGLVGLLVPLVYPVYFSAIPSGADQAMRHLLALGHRRIAIITGPHGWVATEDRRRGYHAALAAAGILPDPELEVESNFEIDGGEQAANLLLDLPEPPTAIFAFNDNHAIGTLRAARARGLRVPDDLSIVGFDDVEHATIVSPTLTTVRQPLAEMGRTAVNMLQRLLDRQRFETLHIELATRLVVRESTAPPR